MSERRTRSVERILLYLCFVCVSLSTVSAALLVLGRQSDAAMWCWLSPLILFGACIITAFRIVRVDVESVASPVFWVILASGVYWGFGPLIYTFGAAGAIAQRNLEYQIGPSELFLTNMVDSVGVLAVVLGLIVGRRWFGKRPIRWVKPQSISPATSAGVLAAVGVTTKLSIVLPRVFGLIGTQSSTLMQLQTLSLAALAILSYLSAIKGRQAIAWFTILLVEETLTASLVNSKMAILEVVIAVLIGRTIALRKPSTMVKGFITIGLMQVILQPVISGYRLAGAASTQGVLSGSVVVAGSRMASSFADVLQHRSRAADASPQEWWSRLCYAPQQGFVMDEYDSGRPGSPWEDFTMALIPRVLWPDKPLVTPGTNFSVLISGEEGNNNAPGTLGEGYWYGGWLGVLAVGLYVGIFLGAVDRITSQVLERRAWLLMPLVIQGVHSGFRIDGFFSTEFLFGSVWYLFFALSVFVLSAAFATLARAIPRGGSPRLQRPG
jgi:hypothetical protein